MRSGVKAGRFQLSTHIAERASGALSEREGAAADQSIDVEHPESDRFHVKRSYGNAERLAFLEEGVAYRTRRLRLDVGHQRLQMIVCSLSVIDSGHSFNLAWAHSRTRSPRNSDESVKW